MHPAYSVIFFTVGSGAGYGLLFLFAFFALAGNVPVGFWFAFFTLGLAFALVTAGLLSSTFHLGHPERSWRALSQWRSSWLSREGVLAVATYPVAGLFALVWLFGGGVRGAGMVSGALGWIAAGTLVLAGLTVGCTAMIYGSLKAVHQWRNRWVVPGFLVFAVMTGALCLNALAMAFGEGRIIYGWLAALSVTVGLAVKVSYWRHIDGGSGKATPETATGLGHIGKVRLLDPPHSQENYLQREMGFKIARKHADRLRRVALWGGFAAPLALVLLAMAAGAVGGAALALVAALAGMGGMLVERWLFFAEAKHTAMLYYGATGS